MPFHFDFWKMHINRFVFSTLFSHFFSSYFFRNCKWQTAPVQQLSEIDTIDEKKKRKEKWILLNFLVWLLVFSFLLFSIANKYFGNEKERKNIKKMFQSEICFPVGMKMYFRLFNDFHRDRKTKSESFETISKLYYIFERYDWYM